jgi:hypothetical protein
MKPVRTVYETSDFLVEQLIGQILKLPTLPRYEVDLRVEFLDAHALPHFAVFDIAFPLVKVAVDVHAARLDNTKWRFGYSQELFLSRVRERNLARLWGWLILEVAEETIQSGEAARLLQIFVETARARQMDAEQHKKT